jgi:hypothetical protein
MPDERLPRTGGPISGLGPPTENGLTASRVAGGPPFIVGTFTQASAEQRMSEVRDLVARDLAERETFVPVARSAPTPPLDIHERLHLVGGPPRFEQSPVVPDRAPVRISARDIWQRGRDATLRPGATLRAAVMHLHDTTEPDGFVHNCVAHPLTWLTQRRWDR